MYFSLPGAPDITTGWSFCIAESSDLQNWTRTGQVAPAAEYEKIFAAPHSGESISSIRRGNGPKDISARRLVRWLRFTRDATNPIWHPTGTWTVGRAIDAEVVGSDAELYAATRDPHEDPMLTGAWA